MAAVQKNLPESDFFTSSAVPLAQNLHSYGDRRNEAKPVIPHKRGTAPTVTVVIQGGIRGLTTGSMCVG